eukprot:TRINITY_DN9509_c0_g5_i2.p1 TRINITY_DN9509_c0_g5~~TRINITY_DN9509_c0_g5_i2.p1  ORF type:complete len:298 (+),score=78.26 TRINITY_DN9509_c0_g5_i2:73-894(+)
MGDRRCNVFNNANPSSGKAMLVRPNSTMESFLQQASEKLRIRGTTIYNEHGGEIDDLDLVRDNDNLYISAGEPFHAKGGPARAAVKGNSTLYSIAIMGPGSVGKSALTLQYVQGIFVIDYDPTIEDAYRKNLSIDGDACMLDILDTAGQEDYVALRNCWCREKDGFLLVFSVDSRSTFVELPSFYEQLQTLNEHKMPPVILVGNKCDTDERQVSEEEGRQMAQRFGAAAYIETSAKKNINVERAFLQIIREIRKTRSNAPIPAPEKKSWCFLF